MLNYLILLAAGCYAGLMNTTCGDIAGREHITAANSVFIMTLGLSAIAATPLSGKLTEDNRMISETARENYLS